MSRFSEAVQWILRTGAQRRELLDSCGKWNSLLKGYARREENGGSYWITQAPNVLPPTAIKADPSNPTNTPHPVFPDLKS